MESYEYRGYCTAKGEEQKKCRNFVECKGGQGICKHLLLGGACNWKQNMTEIFIKLNKKCLYEF
jgi:hypothetical protein